MRKRPRRGKILPVPRRSGRLYVAIEPARVGMFRFLLEAADNLGLMSVVDRFGAVLQIRFSPNQEREVREFLRGMRERVPFKEIPFEEPDAARVLPGTLVYVMGPSGCGKDSLLRGAAELPALKAPEARVWFARRHITRPADAGGEDHIALAPGEFAAKREAEAFALDWESHGLSYGIAAEDIDSRLAQGWTVVLNGSRAYLPEALRRYPGLLPVLIAVRPEILRERLLARGRETAEQIEERLTHAPALPADPPNLVRIDNSGNLAEAVAAFTALLPRGGFPRS